MTDSWSGNPKTWVDGAPAVTAADFNAEIRDRFDALKAGLVGDASVDADIVQRIKTGTAAARPTAGQVGRLYYATDTKTWSIDNGTTWDTPLRVIRKTASEQRASSTLVNDNHLFFPMAANETWIFELYLVAMGVVGADVKYAFATPGAGAGVTLSWSGIGLIVTANARTELVIGGVIDVDQASDSYGLLTANDKIATRINGHVINGATPGNLQLMWAQNIGDVNSPTTLYPSSWLKASKVS